MYQAPMQQPPHAGGAQAHLSVHRKVPEVVRVQSDHRKIANPLPLGYLAFGLATALLQGANTHITGDGVKNYVYPFALFYGGLGQFLAGMWSFVVGKTLAATVFSSWGGFWMSYGLYGILLSAGILERAHDGEKMLFALWGIWTFIFFACSLGKHFAVSGLLLTLSLLSFCLAGGVAAPNPWQAIGGWFGLVSSGFAAYAAAAELFKEEWGYDVLPVGKWKVGPKAWLPIKKVLRKVPPFSYCYRMDEQADAAEGGEKSQGSYHEVDQWAVGVPDGNSGSNHRVTANPVQEAMGPRV